MKTFTHPDSRFKKKSKSYLPRQLTILDVRNTSLRNRYDPGGDDSKATKSQKSREGKEPKRHVLKRKKSGKKRPSLTLPLLSDDSGHEDSETESEYEPKVIRKSQPSKISESVAKKSSPFKPSRSPLSTMSSSQAQIMDRRRIKKETQTLKAIARDDESMLDDKTQYKLSLSQLHSEEVLDKTISTPSSSSVGGRLKRIDKPGRTPPASRLLNYKNTAEHHSATKDDCTESDDESEGSTDIFGDPILKSNQKSTLDKPLELYEDPSSDVDLEETLSHLLSTTSRSPTRSPTIVKSQKRGGDNMKSSYKTASTESDDNNNDDDKDEDANRVGFNVPDNMSFIPLKGIVKSGPHSTTRLQLVREQEEEERINVDAKKARSQRKKEKEAAKNLALLSTGKNKSGLKSFKALKQKFK